MTPYQVLSSNDEGAPHQAPKHKRTRTSRDDVSANIELPHRTRNAGERTASTKQLVNDKENLLASEATIKRLRRQLLKAKKITKNVSTTPKDTTRDNYGDDDMESEEPFDDDEPTSIAFSSSITAMGVVPSTAPQPQKILRKVTKGSATQNKVSSRAFLALLAPPTPNLNTRGNISEETPSRSAGSFRSTATVADNIEFMSQPEDDPAQLQGHSQSISGTPPRPPSPSQTSGPIAHHAGTKRPHSPSRSSSPQPKRTKTQVPQFRDGYVSGGRPKASDYEDVVHALLLRTMREYECLISTKDAFPDHQQQGQWARDCWLAACRAAEESFELQDRMISLIKKRGSRIRGHLLDCVRSQIVSTYGFSRKGTPSAIVHNHVLYTKLITGAKFHYKDVNEPAGYAQNKIISEIIHLAWFEDKGAAGIVFSTYFNPITLDNMAIILTAIEFCLEEWSTGVFVQHKFYEKDVAIKHKTHRKDLEAWSELNPSVVKNMRKKLHDRARRNAGVDSLDTAATRLVGVVKDRARDEMEGRTGETDSEMSGTD